MNEVIKSKLIDLVLTNYDNEACGFTEERSEGNSTDVFNDGVESGRSWLAYEIGCLLGMDLKEPEE